ncbi:hypothetical protein NM2002038_1311 [Neisseria meningitidis 2002038]|nr:hypothetical protein NM2006087_2004 [Neisseria meningitidis 2006087]ELK76191.1 hypothetical protein NM2002038_1311 [Neisseria meningitidis 2002038]
MPVVKPKLRFFEMQIKHLFGNTIKFSQTPLSITPKRFNTIDMLLSSSKLIGTMMDTVMLLIAHIDKTVICFPAVSIDFTVSRYVTTYDLD